MEYIAFMAAIKHDQWSYVLDTLKEYEIGAYLCSKEIAKGVHSETNGEHMHFLVQMTDKDYHKFSKRVFVEKYKLRGKATKDNPRQYGRVKKIENLERMAAYTLKDGNIETNMSESQIEGYKKISKASANEMSIEDKIYKHLSDIKPDQDRYGIDVVPSFKQLAISIVAYMQRENPGYYLSKIKLEKFIRIYQLHHLKIDPEAYVNQLFPFS